MIHNSIPILFKCPHCYKDVKELNGNTYEYTQKKKCVHQCTQLHSCYSTVTLTQTKHVMSNIATAQ